MITGAASGIGRALAVHYAHRGVHSVIGTFPGDPHDPEETLRLVKDAGGQGVIHEVDVRSTPSVDAFAERAVAGVRPPGLRGGQRRNPAQLTAGAR